MPRSGPHHYDAYARAHKSETADRMAARRLMIRKYGAAAAEGRQVDHIKSIKAGGPGRSLKNLRFRDPHANMADKSFYD